MKRNIPVPAGPVAPLSHRWLWWIGPPAVLTWTYRTLFLPETRDWWNPKQTPNSGPALRAILRGGGWRSFFQYAVPSFKGGIPYWLDPE